MSADESKRLQSRLLKGLSKADREQAMDIILNAQEEWSKNDHDVTVHNQFSKRINRAMMDNHITFADLLERRREK
jgi:hypothetical protein